MERVIFFPLVISVLAITKIIKVKTNTANILLSSGSFATFLLIVLDSCLCCSKPISIDGAIGRATEQEKTTVVLELSPEEGVEYYQEEPMITEARAEHAIIIMVPKI